MNNTETLIKTAEAKLAEYKSKGAMNEIDEYLLRSLIALAYQLKDLARRSWDI